MNRRVFVEMLNTQEKIFVETNYLELKEVTKMLGVKKGQIKNFMIHNNMIDVYKEHKMMFCKDNCRMLDFVYNCSPEYGFMVLIRNKTRKSITYSIVIHRRVVETLKRDYLDEIKSMDTNINYLELENA